jgi:hypothetical protein
MTMQPGGSASQYTLPTCLYSQSTGLCKGKGKAVFLHTIKVFEEKNILLGMEPYIIQPILVTIPTELSCLLLATLDMSSQNTALPQILIGVLRRECLDLR